MIGPALEPVALPGALDVLRDEVRSFLSGVDLEPGVDSWLTGFDPGFSRRLGERGWLGMTWPTRYGGHGRSAMERFVVNEELLAAGAPVAAHWIADRQFGPAVLRHGTEEQKARFLPAIASGGCVVAAGMSEPDSGSDLASATTRARKVPGGWAVSGRKVWTSWAHRAHVVLVLVRTGPGVESRHAGLSQLIVELPTAGVEIRPILGATGEHHFNEITFDDALVPDERLLGGTGDGWAQVTGELAFERSGPERFLSVFALVRAYAAAPGRCDEVLGRALARLRVLRAASLAVAAALDGGEAPTVAAALVKDAGTQFEQELVEQILTASEVEPDPAAADDLARLLASAAVQMPGFTLRGGSSDLLRGLIAREVGAR